MTRSEWIQFLTRRVEEERMAYRVERENRDGEHVHAGKADAFSEILEMLGQPFDPLAGKPHLW